MTDGERGVCRNGWSYCLPRPLRVILCAWSMRRPYTVYPNTRAVSPASCEPVSSRSPSASVAFLVPLNPPLHVKSTHQTHFASLYWGKLRFHHVRVKKKRMSIISSSSVHTWGRSFFHPQDELQCRACYRFIWALHRRILWHVFSRSCSFDDNVIWHAS